VFYAGILLLHTLFEDRDFHAIIIIFKICALTTQI
jgi:hypothetical protein